MNLRRLLLLPAFALPAAAAEPAPRLTVSAANMRVNNPRDTERLVREPARRGWNFGDNVWRA